MRNDRHPRLVTDGHLAVDEPWRAGTPASLALAALATALPIVLHLASPVLAIFICILTALLIANFAAPAVVPVLIVSYLFQNLVVALVSPLITGVEEFNSIRAYNFILTAVIWFALALGYWTARNDFDRRFRLLIDTTTAALVLVGGYFVYGALSNPAGAMVYVRNIAAPLLLFQIFALVAYRHRLSIGTPLLTVAVVAAAYGYFEFAAHDLLFQAVNADSYLEWRTIQDRDAGVWVKQMRETGFVFRSYLDILTIDFLNTPLFGDLGLRLYRILGPNFHFISYAYALAFFTIALAATGRAWYALLALPILLLVGSKGALVLTLVSLGAIALLRFWPRAAFPAVAAVLVVYVFAGITLGIAYQDYHVIGLIGGLRGFLVQPIGRGIGVGGNLSLDMSTIDWSKSQYLGHTDVAVESAVGVLLYQMGVFGIALLAMMAWLAWQLWRVYRRSGDTLCAVAGCAVLTILANGIFQEEALFSPLAFGLILGFAGLLLGRAARDPAPARRAPGAFASRTLAQGRAAR